MSEWVQWLHNETNHNQVVDWILKSQKVRLSENYLTGEERATFALSFLASSYKKNSIFQSPFVNVRLAIAVTAGVMLADFIFRSKENRPLMSGDLLLITRQIGLGISELSQVYLNGEPLSKLWEIITGNKVKPSSKHEKPRVIVSAPRPGSLIQPGIKIDTVVIDATHPLTQERLVEILSDPILLSANQTVIIVPLGYTNDGLSNSGPIWTWDFESIQLARQKWKSVNNDYDIQQKWTRRYLVCNDEKTNALLDTARKKLSLLSKHSGTTPPTQLLQAWGIYNQLSSLTVNLGKYEEIAFHHSYAKPIREKIEHLSNNFPVLQTNGKENEVWASEWHPLTESLLNAYRNLKGDEPSKFWPIAFLVEELIDKNFPEPLMVICSTQLEGNLLIKNLASINPRFYEFLNPDGITVATSRLLAGVSNKGQSKIVLTGPFSARWRHLNTAISELTTVVYPYEIFYDTHALESQLEKVLSLNTLQSRFSFLKNMGVSNIKNMAVPQPEDITPKDFINIEIVTDQPFPLHHPYSDHEINLDALSSPSWAWDAEDLTYVPPLPISSSYTNRYKISSAEDDIIGPKVSITLEGGEIIVVPFGQVFDVYRPITEELEEQFSETIESGDILILVQDSNYYRLFERIVEALESHPNFALMSVWLKLWEIIKQELLIECNNSISDLHKKLTQRGVEITEQAVKSWYSGIMAPRDENIIFLMLEFSSNKSGTANKTKIRDALGHVRGMRRAAGRRIREAIKQTAVSKQPEHLPDALNLAIEDVLAACITRRVQTVKHLN